MLLVTHNGSFHYDEVLATAILKKIYKNAKVVRTRDEYLISKGDIVYDVGKIFNPEKGRYDHHQNSFSETFSPEHSIVLSSAGLIYKFFHKQLFELYNFTESHPLFEHIKRKIYDKFFLYADAIDNGVDIGSLIQPRTLSDVVGGFNVYAVPEGEQRITIEERQFNAALSFVSLDLENYLNYIFNDFLSSYDEVYNEISQLSSPIYYTELSTSTDLIMEIDALLGKEIQLVIFKNKDSYRVYSLRISPNSFASRCPLPAAWRGYSNKELIKISNIQSAIFVHKGGFTGGAKTFSDAMLMCEAALEENKKNK